MAQIRHTREWLLSAKSGHSLRRGARRESRLILSRISVAVAVRVAYGTHAVRQSKVAATVAARIGVAAEMPPLQPDERGVISTLPQQLQEPIV